MGVCGARQGPLDSCLAVLGEVQQAASSSVETEKVRKALALLGAWLMGSLRLFPPLYLWTVFAALGLCTSSIGYQAPRGCQTLPFIGRLSIAAACHGQMWALPPWSLPACQCAGFHFRLQLGTRRMTVCVGPS